MSDLVDRLTSNITRREMAAEYFEQFVVCDPPRWPWRRSTPRACLPSLRERGPPPGSHIFELDMCCENDHSPFNRFEFLHRFKDLPRSVPIPAPTFAVGIRAKLYSPATVEAIPDSCPHDCKTLLTID
jgi:hypothetical protein